MASTFAERLKAFRESTHLSQAGFGERSGLSQKMISLLEAGRDPKATYLDKIESAFAELNPTWLRKGAGDMRRLARRDEQSESSHSHLKSSRALDEMTDAELVVYWRTKNEKTEQKLAKVEKQLAEILEAQEHEEIVRLVSSAGGRSGFSVASADAADDDYTPPVMVAETNHEYVEKAAEAERILIGFGRGR